MARVLRVQPLEVAGVRDQFNRFVERHGVAWELAMALLAIVYVAVGFALDDPALQPMASTLETAELILTVVFLIEFTSRLGAATNRMTYLRGHWIDVIALIPAARTLRILRLLARVDRAGDAIGVERRPRSARGPAWRVRLLLARLVRLSRQGGACPKHECGAEGHGEDGLAHQIYTSSRQRPHAVGRAGSLVAIRAFYNDVDTS